MLHAVAAPIYHQVLEAAAFLLAVIIAANLVAVTATLIGNPNPPGTFVTQTIEETGKGLGGTMIPCVALVLIRLFHAVPHLLETPMASSHVIVT